MNPATYGNLANPFAALFPAPAAAAPAAK
jgi:hypothetical protein